MRLVPETTKVPLEEGRDEESGDGDWNDREPRVPEEVGELGEHAQRDEAADRYDVEAVEEREQLGPASTQAVEDGAAGEDEYAGDQRLQWIVNS